MRAALFARGGGGRRSLRLAPFAFFGGNASAAEHVGDESELLRRRQRGARLVLERDELLVVHLADLLHGLLRGPEHGVLQHLLRARAVLRVGLEHVAQHHARRRDDVPGELGRLERAQRERASDDPLVLVQTRDPGSLGRVFVLEWPRTGTRSGTRARVLLVAKRARRAGERGVHQVPQAPHVHRGGEVLVEQHFRRAALQLHVHAVAREGGHGVHRVLLLAALVRLQAHAQTQIRELELAARRAQTVIGLDVVVRHARGVHVGDGGGERLRRGDSLSGRQIGDTTTGCGAEPLRQRLAAPLHRGEHRVRAVKVRAEQKRHAVGVLVQVTMQRHLSFDQRAGVFPALAGGQGDALDRRGAAHDGTRARGLIVHARIHRRPQRPAPELLRLVVPDVPPGADPALVRRRQKRLARAPVPDERRDLGF
mmetsp:Transcript_4876/g.19481  ORF Transcript_4876/g.19481 Transcript_4876/m.19481 type:complete len:425 (+) Transcript_4876:1788-3062(+)